MMTAARPFDSLEAMATIADVIWAALGREDWLEAFAAHPRIGAGGGDAWSRNEQAGVGNDDRTSLFDLNRDYDARFGYRFIICATGRSGDEMRRALERRLGNNPDDELREAAEEQRGITRLRLAKLLT